MAAMVNGQEEAGVPLPYSRLCPPSMTAKPEQLVVLAARIELVIVTGCAFRCTPLPLLVMVVLVMVDPPELEEPMASPLPEKVEFLTVSGPAKKVAIPLSLPEKVLFVTVSGPKAP